MDWNPLRIHINNTLNNLIKLPYQNQSLGETMMYDILLLEKPDTLLYEVVQEYITTQTNHYLISLHELSEVLGRNNLQNMAEVSFANNDLIKLSEYFNTQQLGLLKIRNKDIVDGLYYCSAEFSTWAKDMTGIPNVIYTEGFSKEKDKAEVEMYSLTLLLFLLLVLAILLSALFWHKKTDPDKYDFKKAIEAGLYGCFSLFTGYLVIFIASFFISKIAPDCDVLYNEPQVRFGWQALIGVGFILIPIVINYLVLIRFFSESLHRVVNLFAFFYGSLSATPLFLFCQCFYKNETILYTGRYLVLIPVFLCIAIVLALLYKDVYNMTPGRKQRETISVILLLLAAICALILVIQEPGNPDYLYMVLGLTFFLIGISLPWITIKKISKSKLSSHETMKKITDIPSLRKYFSQPENYVHPSLRNSEGDDSSGDIFKILIEKLFNSDNEHCFSIATIVAPSGTGKTRFLNELSKQI